MENMPDKNEKPKRFFAPNIGKAGRMMRGATALALFAGAGFALTKSVWLGLLLAAAGAFVLFEALRGWCVMRACGVKTKY